MADIAKIIYLFNKHAVVDSEIDTIENSKKPNSKDIFFEEIYTMLNRVQNQLKKIEQDWELDHATVTIRDDIHLTRFYLNIIKELLKTI